MPRTSSCVHQGWKTSSEGRVGNTLWYKLKKDECEVLRLKEFFYTCYRLGGTRDHKALEQKLFWELRVLLTNFRTAWKLLYGYKATELELQRRGKREHNG